MRIRDRIRELRRVPAASLAPNPKNWRTHPAAQADALRGVLAEVGIADAALARELPDGSLVLIDGHLRAETLAGEVIPVLVLDVTAEEADKILLTLDPLAGLADADDDRLRALLDTVETDNAALRALMDKTAADAGLAELAAATPDEPAPGGADDIPEQFGVLVECDTEAQQGALLERLAAEGFRCRSLIS